MKNTFSASGKLFLMASIALFSALAFTACKKDKNKNTNAGMYTISGNASGSQMVPSVSDSGKATLTGTYNANTGVLSYTTNWSGLTGAPTSGGFYSGASGTNGTLIGSTWNLGTGLSSTGTFTGQTTLTSDQATQLLNGNWYYILGTTANANGEVRGQITATAMP